MSAASRSSEPLLDGTFHPGEVCDEYVGAGTDADIDALLPEFDLVIAYRERVGIDSRTVAKQFDGFNAPRYRWALWTSPDEAIQHWNRISAQTYIGETAYDLHTLGEYTICTVTATLLPQADIDPDTGARDEYAYGLREGDVAITGVLSDDTVLDELTQ